MPAVIDLFCGVGGLTHGFLMEGFDVVAGIDMDKTCRYGYETSNDGTRFYNWNLLKTEPDDIAALYPEDEVRILVGCAPCQPYSPVRRGANSNGDERWRLIPQFAKIIGNIRPEIVSMENVPELQSFKKVTIIHEFKNSLEELGYSVFHTVVHGTDYGVPQTRKRFVLLASLLGDIELIEPDPTLGQGLTVQEVIGNLDPLQAGETHSDDILHKARGLSPTNMKRIKQSIPGGTWEDWEDKSLIAPCHQRATGKSYKGVYARMEWDKPAPTITTQAYAFGSGRFGHPKQDRALSLREMALLQTFPQDYVFTAPDETPTFARVGRQIGNAVPVSLARAIAISIRNHLEQQANQ